MFCRFISFFVYEFISPFSERNKRGEGRKNLLHIESMGGEGEKLKSIKESDKQG